MEGRGEERRREGRGWERGGQGRIEGVEEGEERGSRGKEEGGCLLPCGCYHAAPWRLVYSLLCRV